MNIKKNVHLHRYGISVLLVISALSIASLRSVHAANVADFALGEHNICIVDTEGTLECTTNENTQLYLPPDTGTRYSSVASGGAHSCAITEAGDIACWGNNNFGQLDAPVSSSPFVAISASEGHSCALDAAGQIACWGLNTNGQTDVPADNTDFVTIYTGTVGSCGTKSSGLTACWSDTWPYNGIDGQDGIIDLQLIQKDSEGSCAVYEDGSVRCFLSFGGVSSLSNGPYTKVRGNAVMLCGLQTDGALDCNLSDYSNVRTPANLAMLADIQVLPPLVDFDTHFEFNNQMSLCGVDANRELHCLGSLLPADRLPGESANLPVPTNLSMSIYGENVGELLWNVNLSGIGGAPGQFRVYRNGELVNQSYANASYLDRDIELGVPYVYEVSYLAPDGMEGTRSEPLIVNGEFTNPDIDEVISEPNSETQLNGVTLSRYDQNTLEIFWDRHLQSTRQYDVYRNGELVASVPGPSYFDSNVNGTNAYQYTILAKSDSGAIQASGFAQADSLNGLQCF